MAAGTYQVQFFPSTVAPTGQNAYRNVTRTGFVVTNDKVTDVTTTPLN